MNRIVYVGIDVHSTNFTFCSLEPVFEGDDRILAKVQTQPGSHSVVKYIGNLRKELPYEVDISFFIRVSLYMSVP